MSEGGGDDDSEKPYEASAKRLQDARDKGEVPRSTDLMTAASYAGLLIAFTVFGVSGLKELGTVLMVLLDRPGQFADLMLSDGGAAVAGDLMLHIVRPIAPWFLLPAALVLTSILAQHAFTVTGSKLQPKMSRIGLISNAKQKFGRNGLFEFFKSFVKLVVFSAVLAIFLMRELPEMLASSQFAAADVIRLMGKVSIQFLTVVLLVSLIIGAIDFLWQRAEHLRKNRMSHKDLTDEAKQTEGDPHMKQQRRQRGYDIATNRMLVDVPKADVIVVNPEHYAVALKWERTRGSAPICVAKGVDEVAARIREVAGESGVPIHRDPPTARTLHATVAIGDQIRADHFKAVAAAIRFADSVRAKQKGRT